MALGVLDGRARLADAAQAVDGRGRGGNGGRARRPGLVVGPEGRPDLAEELLAAFEEGS